jgi:hypothetical protein
MTGMPNEPEDIVRMLFAYTDETFEDRLRQELAKQTFVGGKRVAKQELPELPKRAGSTVHVLKVNLHGAKPPVWRRLEVPSAITLDRVHEVLLVAFRWWGWHLHCFETVCGEFGDLSSDYDWSGHQDESKVALAQVAAAEKAKVVYVYDFGDDWRHDLVVEKVVPAVPGVAYPRCTGGRGADTPLDGSGGIWVFNDERAQEGGPVGSFDAAGLTGTLAGLATVVTPAP